MKGTNGLPKDRGTDLARSPKSRPASGVERFLLGMGMHPVEAAGGFRPETTDARFKKTSEQLGRKRTKLDRSQT